MRPLESGRTFEGGLYRGHFEGVLSQMHRNSGQGLLKAKISL